LALAALFLEASVIAINVDRLSVVAISVCYDPKATVAVAIDKTIGEC